MQNVKIKTPMETEPITDLPVAVFRNYEVNFACFQGYVIPDKYACILYLILVFADPIREV